MLKHYVTFSQPGSFFPEHVTRKVATRIPARLRKIPEGTFAIDFFDRTETPRDGEILVGKVKNKSPRILFGTKYDLKGLEDLGYSEKDILYRNIQGSWPFACKCITGNWQPVDIKETVLSDYSELRTMKEAL